MKIMPREDIKTGQIFANIILTKEELERLVDGQVVNAEELGIQVQIVGYGEVEESEVQQSEAD